MNVSQTVFSNVKYFRSVISKNVIKRSLHLTRKMFKENLITTPEIIEKAGYPCEIHTVTTEDGYILELHRIPYGKQRNDSFQKPAIYLQHGLLCTSFDWVVAGPSKALAYILADNGYDVWLGNARGNRYSKAHQIYQPDKDKKFWNFSWHEIGVYDIASTIDYTLRVTNQNKLYYVGHSQGTTAFYVLMSEFPIYNHRIRLMISLAPVAFMSNMKSPSLKLTRPLFPLIEFLTNRFGYSEHLPNTSMMSKFFRRYAGREGFDKFIKNYFSVLFGSNKKNYDEKVIKQLLTNYPGGASNKQIIHYYQSLKDGRFRQFDYGIEKNKKIYLRSVPPEYELHKIDCPIALFYSENDYLSSAYDVEDLCHKLGNCVGKYLVNDPKFNHIDYLYGLNAPQVLYPSVLDLLAKY